MSKENNNATSSIRSLWERGFFRSAQNLKSVSEEIIARWEHNFSTSSISRALGAAKFLTRTGRVGSFQYVQKTSPVSKKIKTVEEQLFSYDLINKLGHPFKVEIEDLHFNFGKSGTCTAFLLRKILEKEIYLAFTKSGQGAKLEDKTRPGRLIGLGAMIDTAAREKKNGIPFLQSKTAMEIKGIKFLGDVSAHSALSNVDMETILPQMPFIITAYKELVEFLN